MIVALIGSVTFAPGSSAQVVGDRDMTCAGKTLLQSALVMAQAIADGKSPTSRCNINGDRKIDNQDVRGIQQCDVGTHNWQRCANVGVDLPRGRHTLGYFDEAIDLTSALDKPTNVTGTLNGSLAFVQETYVTPSGNAGRPNLVPDRTSLMLFYPTDEDQFAISAKVRTADGVKYYELAPPEDLPQHDGPTGTEPVMLTTKAWSAVIDAADMQPGMSIRFTNGDNETGVITDRAFTFGAPMELTTFAFTLGMLTSPSGNQLLDEGIAAEVALDYFNKVPVSKLRMAAYESIELKPIVMPNGRKYTEKSSYTRANEHRGDMREHIGKALISSGISFANIGMPVTAGTSQVEPRPFRQSNVFTSRGIYTDGNGNPTNVYHGQSGGNGDVLIFRATGNEFPHEIGHDHGLWHFSAGPYGNQGPNGGFGYDIFRDRLRANIAWAGVNPDAELPWSYNRDPMRSGGYSGSVGLFALHTPAALATIQSRLGASGWHDASSPTGYSRWDVETQTVVPWTTDTHKLPVPYSVGVPVTTLVGFYDPQGELESWMPDALHGNWGVTFNPTQMNQTTGYPSSCTIRVKGRYRDRVFNLRDTRISPAIMNKFHVNVEASFRANKAIVTCGGKTLLEKDLVGPTGELGDVIEIGRGEGFGETALSLPIRLDVTSRLEKFEHKLGGRFGPIETYIEGTVPELGRLYAYDGGYYQAQSTAVSTPPGNNWRTIVADVNEYVKDNPPLAVGERSRKYQKSGDYVSYGVAIDFENVLDSDVANGRGKYFSSAQWGFVLVMGRTEDGRKQPITLRVQQNGKQKSNTGLSKNAASTFAASYHPEDNLTVPKGTYQVDFEVQPTGWYSRTVIDAFRVTGPVTVE